MFVESEGYAGDQIYNCDEPGLLWRALPGETLASSIYKRSESYMLNKDRVTLNFSAKSSGNDSLHIFFIG